MRTVARYSFEAECEDAHTALNHYLALADRLNAWLDWKGELIYAEEGNLACIRYKDGREAVAKSQRWMYCLRVLIELLP